MKHNKRALPLEAKDKKHKLHSSIFYEDKNGSLLTVYQCKPAKSVLVLSTLHEYGTIPSSYKKDQKILENVNGSLFFLIEK